MTVGDERLLNKKTTEAREVVVAWLRDENLLEKEEAIEQNISTAERTGGVIEPLPKLQWFINVNKEFAMPHSELKGIATGDVVTLKKLMRHVVENGQIKFVPDHFTKIYFHWIDNLRDWCISRQIWFGHRIPVWYKGQEIHADIQPPTDDGWEQDPDTLDTWFSSGLWTFSTLGWPTSTTDLTTYHPTQIMETAYEILFFWVARMILMTTYLVGQVPFETVYLHGLVRDAKREKLSKSKSDSADPLDLIAKFGTDALRFALVFNTAPGADSILSEDKIKGMKHFANKLWNIARYIISSVESYELRVEGSPLQAMTDADKDILVKLEQTIKDVTGHIENFRLHEAAQSIYQFTWHELADVYIEASKAQLQDEKLKANTQAILRHVLIMNLKLLHPFMPFITEHLWSELSDRKLLNKGGLLMVSAWPK
jgi:valyl-tRNA synthetase